MQKPVPILALQAGLAFQQNLEDNSSYQTTDKNVMPSKESITDCCRGLVAIDKGTSSLVLDYDEIGLQIPRYWTSEYNQRLRALTRTSVRYLLIDEFKDTYCSQEESSVSTILDRHPFLIHAAQFTAKFSGRILCRSENGQSEQLHDLVNALLERPSTINLVLQILFREEGPEFECGRTWVEEIRKIESMSFLQKVTRLGLSSQVQLLLQKKHGVELRELLMSQDSDGCTPLHLAASACSKDVVQELIAKGAYVGVKDRYEWTPLHYAYHQDDPDVFDILLEKYCVESIGKYSWNSERLLGGFVKRSSLLEYYKSRIGEILDLPTSQLQEKLCRAAQHGDLAQTLHLLDLGVDANCVDSKFIPALHHTIRNGSLHLIRALLESGADPSKSGVYTGSALHVAAARGDAKAVEILLQYGADVRVIDFRGRTALFDAVNQGDVSIVRTLLVNRVDIDATDQQGRRALHEAAEYGNLEILRLLLHRVKDKMPKATNGDTPLNVARTDEVRHVLQKAIANKEFGT
jgi:ankyrin repeat protein